MLVRRALALAAIVASAFLASTGTLTARASGWPVYHNAQYGYSFSYPPDWERGSAGFARALGADFVVNTTDQDTTFFAITPAAVEASIKSHARDYAYYELVNLGVSRGATLHFSSVHVHGVSFTQGYAQIVEAHERGTVTVLLTFKGNLAYVFASTRLTDQNGKPRRDAAAQGAALTRIESTITLS